jgi:hypothetical protein
MTSQFIDYKSINPRLTLLEERFYYIREEYLSNKEKLEFRDFTKEQDKHISEVGRGYPIEVDSYFSANLKQNDNLGWHMGAVFCLDIPYERNSKFLPILTDTLKEIGGLSVCGINILDSGIQLNWHHDSDYGGGGNYNRRGNTNNIRLTFRSLWGLDVPIEDGRSSIMQMKDRITGEIETKEFKNGEVFGFWPDTLHRVENNLTQPRTILAVDAFVK